MAVQVFGQWQPAKTVHLLPCQKISTLLKELFWIPTSDKNYQVIIIIPSHLRPSDMLKSTVSICWVSIKAIIALVGTRESGMRFLTKPLKKYVHVQSDPRCLQIIWNGDVFNPLIHYRKVCSLLLSWVLFLLLWCYEPLAMHIIHNYLNHHTRSG